MAKEEGTRQQASGTELPVDFELYQVLLLEWEEAEVNLYSQDVQNEAQLKRLVEIADETKKFILQKSEAGGRFPRALFRQKMKMKLRDDNLTRNLVENLETGREAPQPVVADITPLAPAEEKIALTTAPNGQPPAAPSAEKDADDSLELVPVNMRKYLLPGEKTISDPENKLTIGQTIPGTVLVFMGIDPKDKKPKLRSLSEWGEKSAVKLEDFVPKLEVHDNEEDVLGMEELYELVRQDEEERKKQELLAEALQKMEEAKAAETGTKTQQETPPSDEGSGEPNAASANSSGEPKEKRGLGDLAAAVKDGDLAVGTFKEGLSDETFGRLAEDEFDNHKVEPHFSARAEPPPEIENVSNPGNLPPKNSQNEPLKIEGRTKEFADQTREIDIWSRKNREARKAIDEGKLGDAQKARMGELIEEARKNVRENVASAMGNVEALPEELLGAIRTGNEDVLKAYGVNKFSARTIARELDRREERAREALQRKQEAEENQKSLLRRPEPSVREENPQLTGEYFLTPEQAGEAIGKQMLPTQRTIERVTSKESIQRAIPKKDYKHETPDVSGRVAEEVIEGMTSAELGYRNKIEIKPGDVEKGMPAKDVLKARQKTLAARGERDLERLGSPEETSADDADLDRKAIEVFENEGGDPVSVVSEKTDAQEKRQVRKITPLIKRLEEARRADPEHFEILAHTLETMQKNPDERVYAEEYLRFKTEKKSAKIEKKDPKEVLTLIEQNLDKQPPKDEALAPKEVQPPGERPKFLEQSEVEIGSTPVVVEPLNSDAAKEGAEYWEQMKALYGDELEGKPAKIEPAKLTPKFPRGDASWTGGEEALSEGAAMAGWDENTIPEVELNELGKQLETFIERNEAPARPEASVSKPPEPSKPLSEAGKPEAASAKGSGEPREVKEIDRSVLRRFEEKFGITEEHLAKIEGFGDGELSVGRQLLVLKNLESMVLSDLTKEAKESRKEEVAKLSIWGKLWNATKAVATFGSYDYARTKQLETELLARIRGGSAKDPERTRALLDDIRELAKVVQAGPAVEVKPDGMLDFRYILPNEVFGSLNDKRLTSENLKIMEQFNTSAGELAQLPREWGYEPKNEKAKEEYKRYAAKREAFENSRKALLSQCVERLRESGVNNPERIAMLAMNQLDEHVQLNQLFTAHSDAERALAKIENQKAWWEGAKEFMRDKGKYVLLGAGTRIAAAAITGGAIAPLLIAVGVGGGVGALQGKAERKKIIRERRIDRRMSEEDEREEITYTQKSTTGEEKSYTRKLKEYTDATFFADRIARLTEKLEAADEPKEKELLEKKIAQTTALMEEKFTRGLINFGGSSLEASDARKGRDIANRLSFIQAMAKGEMIEVVDEGKLKASFAEMIDLHQEKITDAEKREILMAAGKAGLIRGTIAGSAAWIVGEFQDRITGGKSLFDWLKEKEAAPAGTPALRPPVLGTVDEEMGKGLSDAEIPKTTPPVEDEIPTHTPNDFPETSPSAIGVDATEASRAASMQVGRALSPSELHAIEVMRGLEEIEKSTPGLGEELRGAKGALLSEMKEKGEGLSRSEVSRILRQYPQVDSMINLPADAVPPLPETAIPPPKTPEAIPRAGEALSPPPDEATESLSAPQAYTVQSGDNLTKILLREIPGTTETDIQNMLRGTSVGEWKNIGIQSGNPHEIKPDETLDMEYLREMLGKPRAEGAVSEVPALPQETPRAPMQPATEETAKTLSLLEQRRIFEENSKEMSASAGRIVVRDEAVVYGNLKRLEANVPRYLKLEQLAEAKQAFLSAAKEKGAALSPLEMWKLVNARGLDRDVFIPKDQELAEFLANRVVQ